MRYAHFCFLKNAFLSSPRLLFRKKGVTVSVWLIKKRHPTTTKRMRASFPIAFRWSAHHRTSELLCAYRNSSNFGLQFANVSTTSLVMSSRRQCASSTTPSKVHFSTDQRPTETEEEEEERGVCSSDHPSLFYSPSEEIPQKRKLMTERELPASMRKQQTASSATQTTRRPLRRTKYNELLSRCDDDEEVRPSRDEEEEDVTPPSLGDTTLFAEDTLDNVLKASSGGGSGSPKMVDFTATTTTTSHIGEKARTTVKDDATVKAGGVISSGGTVFAEGQRDHRCSTEATTTTDPHEVEGSTEDALFASLSVTSSNPQPSSSKKSAAENPSTSSASSFEGSSSVLDLVKAKLDTLDSLLEFSAMLLPLVRRAEEGNQRRRSGGGADGDYLDYEGSTLDRTFYLSEAMMEAVFDKLEHLLLSQEGSEEISASPTLVKVLVPLLAVGSRSLNHRTDVYKRRLGQLDAEKSKIAVFSESPYLSQEAHDKMCMWLALSMESDRRGNDSSSPSQKKSLLTGAPAAGNSNNRRSHLQNTDGARAVLGMNKTSELEELKAAKEAMVLLEASVKLQIGDVPELQLLVQRIVAKSVVSRMSPHDCVVATHRIAMVVKKRNVRCPPLTILLSPLSNRIASHLDKHDIILLLSCIVNLKDRRVPDVVRSATRVAARHVRGGGSRDSYSILDTIFMLRVVAHVQDGVSPAFSTALFEQACTLTPMMSPRDLGELCHLLSVIHRRRDVQVHCRKELHRLIPLVVVRAERLVQKFSLRQARAIMQCMTAYKVKSSLVFSRLTPILG